MFRTFNTFDHPEQLFEGFSAPHLVKRQDRQKRTKEVSKTLLFVDQVEESWQEGLVRLVNLYRSAANHA